MKTLLILLPAMLFNLTESLGMATASFMADRDVSLQLFIDGKVINSKPKARIKVKGKAGRHDLVIKVFDAEGCLTYVHEGDFFATSGFQSYFQFVLKPENCSELRQVKVSRIYSERIRRPADFYNKRLIATFRKLQSDQFGVLGVSAT